MVDKTAQTPATSKTFWHDNVSSLGLHSFGFSLRFLLLGILSTCSGCLCMPLVTIWCSSLWSVILLCCTQSSTRPGHGGTPGMVLLWYTSIPCAGDGPASSLYSKSIRNCSVVPRTKLFVSRYLLQLKTNHTRVVLVMGELGVLSDQKLGHNYFLSSRFSMEGDKCLAGWAFTGKLGEYTAKAYGITEYIVHLLIPAGLLIFFYGKLIYKINIKREAQNPSATMEKVGETQFYFQFY